MTDKERSRRFYESGRDVREGAVVGARTPALSLRTATLERDRLQPVVFCWKCDMELGPARAQVTVGTTMPDG